MALKPLRETERQRIDMFMNVTGERGCVVVYDPTSLTGLGDMDDASSRCVQATASNEAAIGILMCDVVNRDLARDRLNWHQNEVQVGSKVEILTRGSVRTNMVLGNPVPGSGVSLGAGGTMTMAAIATAYPGIKLRSAKDVDGYTTIEVNLP